MGHFIQAIVAPHATANMIATHWPELPRLDRENGYAVFLVDADLIDVKIEPDKTPPLTDNTLILLTDGFRKLLKAMSRNGQLAYVETEYFGGDGGQGGVVFRDGVEIMPPTWDESNTINEALGIIGIERGDFADRFDAVGFCLVRSNDDIRNLIQAQTSSNKE